jgi:hypothetical protein
MDHGWTIQLIGFVLVFGGFLLWAFGVFNHNPRYLKTANPMVVVGIVLYVTGRVAVLFHNKRKKQLNYSEDL